MQINAVIKPIGQILNMGGPWIGNLIINGSEYEGKFVDQHLVIDETTQMLYVVRYFDDGYFRWQVHFKIQAISLSDNRVYFSRRKYKALCLEKAINNTLFYRENFCEGAMTVIESLEFNNDNFQFDCNLT